MNLRNRTDVTCQSRCSTSLHISRYFMLVSNKVSYRLLLQFVYHHFISIKSFILVFIEKYSFFKRFKLIIFFLFVLVRLQAWDSRTHRRVFVNKSSKIYFSIFKLEFATHCLIIRNWLIVAIGNLLAADFLANSFHALVTKVNWGVSAACCCFFSIYFIVTLWKS